MAMCAGVQKVSRPIERCQETSQCAPIETDVTASTAHHRYHGIELPDGDSRWPWSGLEAFQVLAIACFPPATILIGYEMALNSSRQVKSRTQGLAGAYMLVYHGLIHSRALEQRPRESTCPARKAEKLDWFLRTTQGRASAPSNFSISCFCLRNRLRSLFCAGRASAEVHRRVAYCLGSTCFGCCH